MPLNFHRNQKRGEFHDNKAQSTGRVNTFGQVAIQFHKNTHALRHWIDKAQDEAAACRPARCARPRRGSTTLVDEFIKEQTGNTSAPRLNIAIHICGSRGDVQPFIPIAKLLQAAPYHHRVRICTHPAFKDFVESNGVEFFSIGGDPEALMAYMVKNPGLLPNMQSIKAGDIGKRRKEMAEMMEGTWRSCIEAGDGMGERMSALNVDVPEDLFIADAIIANPPSMGHIHCAEKLGIPLHMVFTMPWSPTKAFHHPLAAMEYGEVEKSVANYFSFGIMELLTWQGLGDVINKFRTQTLGLDAMSPLWGHRLLSRLRIPYSYLWSQALIPRPSDWGDHIHITGFSFLDAGSNYTPPDDLTEFLAKGPPPVYIGFGSIVVDDPVGLTKLLFEAVKLAGVRAIVSKGWGGVGGGDVPENIYLIGNCPHDWLFKRVSCVVHHGGAGTTAAGIALGKPTVAVPFFGDQPFWGQMIAKAGAGPVPVPFKQMTAESLANSITFALQDSVQVAVQNMAASIAEEDGAGDTMRDFEQRLNIDAMRCQLCPERLAVWRDKQTGAHLSGLAAWAEGPFVGAVAAFGGLMASLGTDTAEFSQRLKKRPRESDVEALKRTLTRDDADDASLEKGITSRQFHHLAYRMAAKSYEDDMIHNFEKPSSRPGLTALRDRVTAGRAKGGRGYQIVSATAHYIGDLTATGAKAPVALFYNMANGFRNFPSYAIRNDPARRRDEITGFGSGCKLAGKEFVLGFGDALVGIARHPYLGAKQEGALGFGKGLGRGLGGLYFHSMAAIFGVPGYFLKGIERALLARHLTAVQAEIFFIQLRRSGVGFRGASDAEKADLVALSAVATAMSVFMFKLVKMRMIFDKLKKQGLDQELNPFKRWNPMRPLIEWWNGKTMDRYIGTEMDKQYEDWKTNEPSNRAKSVMDIAIAAYMTERKAVAKLNADFKNLHLLSKHPDALAKVRAELDEVFGYGIDTAITTLKKHPERIDKIPYTAAIIKENLRLFPQAAGMRGGLPGVFLRDRSGNKYPTEDINILILHGAVQRNPKYWPEPHEILPERWLVEPGHRLYPPKDVWRPFKAGSRNRVGQTLAMLDIKITFAMTVCELDIHDRYDEWDWMHPSSGVKTVFGERAYQVPLGAAHPVHGFPCKVTARGVSRG
ncbi:glycosyltransferase family 1 protein [Stemphylium lycopersici]|nr:glycosyltransferase family 1 protein [Stemphylium lycopersici]